MYLWKIFLQAFEFTSMLSPTLLSTPAGKGWLPGGTSHVPIRCLGSVCVCVCMENGPDACRVQLMTSNSV